MQAKYATYSREDLHCPTQRLGVLYGDVGCLVLELGKYDHGNSGNPLLGATCSFVDQPRIFPPYW